MILQAVTSFRCKTHIFDNIIVEPTLQYNIYDVYNSVFLKERASNVAKVLLKK